jgi:hypothetical protein
MTIRCQELGMKTALCSFALLMLACAGAQVPRVSNFVKPQVATESTPPPAKATALPDGVEYSEARRLELFSALLEKVRDVHVFSRNTERNLGFTFQDGVPALREEFRRATSRALLQVALTHFGMALHDTHCRYQVDAENPSVRLPFRVGAFKSTSDAHQLEFRVTSVAKDEEVERTWETRDTYPGVLVERAIAHLQRPPSKFAASSSR